MERSLRVLHVDDSEQDAGLLTRHFSRAGYELISQSVRTPAEMRVALETEKWDVILCDHSMPHFNALQVLALLKEMELDLPFIITSGNGGAAVAVEAMYAGALDYSNKDNLASPTIGREMNEAENRRPPARAQPEKTQLTAQIESQRQRLNNIVANVPGVVWEAWGEPDAATQQIDFVSDYVERMLGYTVEEWLQTPNFWLSIVHPEDRERIACSTAENYARGGQATLEFRWVAKDGSVVWVESNYAVITDDEGRSVGMRGVNTDISARKQAEEALRESEERYKGLTDFAFDGVAIMKDSVIRSANRAFAEMFGFTVEELLRMDVLQLSSEPEFVRSQIAKGEPRYETIGLKKDGTHIDIEVSAKACLYEGEPARLTAVRDITNRKRAEEALRESEERYRDTVENARDMIYTHDLEGNYTSINKAGEQITGYTRAEVRRLSLAQTVAPECLEKAHQMIVKKLAGDEETIDDLEIIAKDGRRIAVEVNTRLVYRDGIAIGVQGIARDVTERKHLEEELRQSQKMEAVGRLAGGIAHDFNNLLTVINGYSELSLLRLQPEDALTLNLEEIKRAGSRAASLTRQLLAFSRKQVLQPKVLDLNAVISELERMLPRLIGENIDLRTVLTPDLRRVNADPGQIEQVIMNLVVNARDAMPEGGKLTIETENVYLTEDYARHRLAVKPGAYAMIAVSDNGSGMNDETKANIFEPFFTTKGRGKGTGLGLSTVYGIVKQSMGTIWVYSEVALGTTFKVYLPCVDDEFDKRQPSQTSQPIALGSETLLLVEDDEMVRGLTRTVLEQSGYKVIQAANGAEALRICEQYEGPIHLLVTDVVMPGMSGRAVADRLKALRPQMLVLYMSGYTDDAIVHHGVLNEGVNFVEKPFATAALSRKVRDVLDSA